MNQLMIKNFELLLRKARAQYLLSIYENDKKTANVHEFRIKYFKNFLKIFKTID